MIDPLYNPSFDVFDAAGDVIQSTDADGRVIQFVYDALGHQTQENWLDGSDIVRSTITSYDPDGEVVSVVDPGAQYAYTYDQDGRVLTASTALGTLTYAYDADGDTTSVSDNYGGQSAYQFDALGQLTQVEQALNGTVNELAALAYNDDGSLKSINRYANANQTVLVATSSYGYDGDGRMTSLDHTQNSNVLDDYSISYDLASNVTSVTSTLDGTTSYTGYDASNQLTAVTGVDPLSVSYDQNGNRVGAGYVTGADNRLLADPSYTYEYDNDGNLIKQTSIADGSWTAYTWDYENRLVEVTYSTGESISYTYDCFGQRICEAVTVSGVTSYYYGVYDDGQPLLEFSATVALSNGGTLTETHRYLVAGGQVLADDQFGNGQAHAVWLLPDNNGNIVDLVARVVPQFGFLGWGLATHETYTAFGAAAGAANYYSTHIASAVGFGGGFTDSVTGLVEFGARWYNPLASVWISADPSGFASGDANFYRYCGNNPATNVDPSGLCYGGLGSQFTATSDYSGGMTLQSGGLLPPLTLDYPSDLATVLQGSASSSMGGINISDGWSSQAIQQALGGPMSIGDGGGSLGPLRDAPQLVLSGPEPGDSFVNTPTAGDLAMDNSDLAHIAGPDSFDLALPAPTAIGAQGFLPLSANQGYIKNHPEADPISPEERAMATTLSVAFLKNNDLLDPAALAADGEYWVNNRQLVIRPNDSWSDINGRLADLAGLSQFGDVIVSGHGGPSGISNWKIGLEQLQDRNSPESQFVRLLGSSMLPGSTIRLQACSVAATPNGLQFLQLWADLSQQTVVAWDDVYAVVPHGQEWIATPGGGTPKPGTLYPPFKGSKIQQKEQNDGFTVPPEQVLRNMVLFAD